MKNKLLKILFFTGIVFYSSNCYAAWTNLAANISSQNFSGGGDVAVFFSGCGVSDTGAQSWATALIDSKLKNKGVGYAYAVALPGDGGNCSTSAVKIKNSEIIKDIETHQASDAAKNIILIIHSSGAFTAVDFLKQVNSKDNFKESTTAFNIDGDNSINLYTNTLKKTYAVIGKSGTVGSLYYGTLTGDEKIDISLPSGCSTNFCTHMKLINKAGTGVVDADYKSVTVSSVTNEYLDKIPNVSSSNQNTTTLGNNNVNTNTNLKAESSVTSFNADTGTYELISPIGNLDKIEDRSPNGFSDFVNLLIRIAIALAGAIAVVIIIISGIQYMGTDSVWEKGESKGRMGMAIGGLVLLLCSYLVLYTINPDLVNIKIGVRTVKSGVWDAPVFPKSDGTYTAPPKGSNAKGCAGGTIEGKPIVSGATWPQDKQNKFIEELKQKNVSTVSSGGKFCKVVGERACTGMYFNAATETLIRDRLTKLQIKTGAALTVTGGSECWLHSTHGPDDANLDLQITPELNKAITGKDSFPSGKVVTLKGIGDFLAEGAGGSSKNTGAHWHAMFK